MKNNLRYLIIIILVFTHFKANAQDDFVFESKSLEFLNSTNQIRAKNGVKIKDNKGIEITADQSTYSKNSKFLEIKTTLLF